MLNNLSQPIAQRQCMLNFSPLNIGVMERHERVAHAIAVSGKRKNVIAAECGVRPSAVTQWTDGTSKSMKPENLYALAKATGFNAEWLAIGEGPKQIEANATMIGMMSPWDSRTPLYDDEVAIPLFKEIELAAGDGSTQVVEVPGRKLRFARSTLREAGVQECNAACATLTGGSMERLIMDGATIGIDRGTTNIIDGEIYAFDHDGMLRVKYLYRQPGGGMRIRSENDEEYPDEIIQPEEMDRIRILGWVFWWSTVRRRNGMKIAR